MSVGKGGGLGSEEIEAYSRQIALEDIGYEGQMRLRKGRACLIGIGGLGSPVALQLAAIGVGYIKLIDRDVVSRSDLHRQYIYDTDSIGLPKVEVAAKKLSRLAQGLKIEAVPESVTPFNVEEMVKGVDVVVDGLDGIESRYMVNRACVKLGIPYIFGAAIEMFGNATTIIPGKTPCIECFYTELSDEHLDRCAVVGIHPSVLGIISAAQASEAVRLMMGKEPHLAGRLLYVDLRSFSFDLVNLSRSPKCAVCSYGEGLVKRPVQHRVVEGGCGRDGRGIFTVVPSSRSEIDIRRLAEAIEAKGLGISTRGDLGLTFDYNEKVKVSVLKSGTAIMQVAPDAGILTEEEALEAYRSMAKELGLPKVELHV